MKEKLRIGIVGTSWWTDTFHLPGLSRHPRAEIMALCGRNAENAQALAQKYSVPHVFTDYRTLVESQLVDALVIVTPDDLHYPVTMAALDAGLHVLCEKPLALNVVQAREMVEKAEASALIHMVNFTWSWMPHFQYLRRLLDQGILGRPYRASFRFMAGFGRTTDYNWRYDPRQAHGVAADLGSHMIQLARWFLGDISHVSAHLRSFVPKTRLVDEGFASENDDALILLEFADGAHGVMEVSAVADVGDHGFEQEVVLYGEHGALEVKVALEDDDAGATIRGTGRGQKGFVEYRIPDALWGNVNRSQPFVGQILDLFANESVGGRQFVDAVLEGRQPQPSFEEGLRVQEVIDAILRSHEQRCWVAVNSVSQ